MNKKIVGLVAILVIAIAGLYLPISQPVSKEIIREIVGSTPGGDFYTPVSFNDSVVYASRTLSTTTGATSGTLVARDLLNTDYFLVTIGGAANTDFTYTFPATTTLGNFVPQVGNRVNNVCFFNVASSTANQEVIFAAGAGINLVHSTSTLSAGLAIREGNTACFDFQREPKPTAPTIPGDITTWMRLGTDSD